MFMNETASVGLLCDELKFFSHFLTAHKMLCLFPATQWFCVCHVGSGCNKSKTLHSCVCLGRAKFRTEELAAFEFMSVVFD